MSPLDDLLQKFRDGSLSAAESEELVRLMGQPQARKEWVKIAMLESAVRQAHQRENVSKSTRIAIQEMQQSVEKSREIQLSRRTRPGRLAARRNHSRVWTYIGMAAAVMLVAGAVHYFNVSRLDELRDSLTGTIVELNGTAQIQSGGGSQAAQIGLRVAPGETLKAAPDSVVHLRYPDNTLLIVHSDTELAFLPTEKAVGRGKCLRLEKGSLSASVTPQPPGAPLVAETPVATATVVGTKFDISAQPNASRLDVTEGHVRFERREKGGQSVTVDAGNFAVADAQGLMPMTPQPIIAAVPSVATGSNKTPAPAADPSLVAHWNFDEGRGDVARDSSGHGYDGRLYNQPRWTEGGPGAALSFDGQNEYMEIEERGEFVHLSQGTFMAWIKSTESGSRRMNFFHASSAAFSGVEFGLLGEKLNIEFANPGIINEYRIQVPLADRSTWNHIAYVSDARGPRIYINGLQQLPTVVTGNASRAPLFFAQGCRKGAKYRIGGSIYQATNQTFKGLIGEVRIYSRPLTADEIKTAAELKPTVNKTTNK